VRPELRLHGVHGFERRDLEGQMMQTGRPRLEWRPALLPERQEQPPARAQQREAAAGLS
jgi:hypothetical protein